MTGSVEKFDCPINMNDRHGSLLGTDLDVNVNVDHNFRDATERRHVSGKLNTKNR